jgi:hypothetical protein
MILLIGLGSAQAPAGLTDFVSKRYGLRLTLPPGCEILEREREDRILIARLASPDPSRPALLACELGLAPESLDAWRTRIDRTAQLGRRPATLVRNEVVQGPAGPQLETIWEYRLPDDQAWLEHATRIVANRQLYTFLIRVDAAHYQRVLDAYKAILGSAVFSPPETGCAPVPGAAHRWQQQEYRFALDLPTGWKPALAPAEIALLYATAPAREIWSDNVLVLARPHRAEELARLARELPDQLRAEEPDCEILQCSIVPHGSRQALETIVRTQRGPFSITVLERRFAGERFDYEIKFTIESPHFEPLLPELRRCLDSFRELPGEVPGAGKPT